ncbi:uncharacterized protein LOC130360772 isoform X2 [Hyla sarda]|uniref:uncharacterized protein LOC130360772 isoform X2 n=1 Tax=Hyla sarda TaxID=327740 RepID=UPI0024C3A378|nr:uncharacterized protein LOC130360772 isoform X2 [Hyla sarda]
MHSPTFSNASEDEISGPTMSAHSGEDQDTQIDFTQTQSESQSQNTSGKKRKATSKKADKKSKSKTKNLEYAVDPTDFQSEEVIDLVQERPSLWDRTHPKHSDNNYNRRRWHEIFVAIFPDFESYGTTLRNVIKDNIAKRWRSVRDSYFKYLRDCQLPSGSSAKKSQYKHATRLSFLDRVQEMRGTTSNTAPQIQEQPKEIQEAGTDVDIERHHSSTVENLRRHISERHSTRRSHSSNWQEAFLEAIEKLENSFTNKLLQLDLRLLRVEGLVSGPTPSPNRDFALGLVSEMEKMSEEQLNNFKSRVLRISYECLHPQPKPIYPPPSPSVHQSRKKSYSSSYPYQQPQETFEEEGQIYRRI